MSFHCPSFDRLTDPAQLGQGGAQQFDLFGPATSPPSGKLVLTSPDAAMATDHHYRAALPAVSVYALPGHVLGSAGLLLQNDSVFWRGDVLPNYFRDAFQPEVATPDGWLHGMRLPDVEMLHFDEPLAVATHPNAVYGHFLLEMLPRLYLLSLLRDMGQPFRLALSTQTPEWMEPFIALYFAAHEIVHYESMQQLVRAPTFVMPAMLNVDYYLHPAMNLAAADFVARVRAQTSMPSQSASPLIYLSRRRFQDGSRSSMVNAEVVEAALDGLGFAIVHPENLSIREQVELYSQATCIVSEYGSAAHNALFAPRGCTIIVINRLNNLQARIAALRGQTLGVIQPVEGFRLRDNANPEQIQRFSVDPELLRRMLNMVMETPSSAAVPAPSLPEVAPSAPLKTEPRPSIDATSTGHNTPTRQTDERGLGMFEQARAIVDEAERLGASGSAVDVIRQLRQLCLSDFSDLLATLPLPSFPNISAKLPRMASAEVQQSWTGGSGPGMSQATLDFVRIVNYHYTLICQRPLAHAKILDYGCGYGRLMRPFYYFTNPDRIFGIDPWDKSLEICMQDGVLGQLRQSEFLPNSLPVDDEKFDLIYSFSVFTHTSVAATTTALNALRKCISSSGVLVLTTRPLEYWPLVGNQDREGFNLTEVLQSHKTTGFYHLPSNWNLPADGVSIFGDTSFTTEWCMKTFPSWDVRSYDRGLDPMQMILLLTPR